MGYTKEGEIGVRFLSFLFIYLNIFIIHRIWLFK
jgi:hypothetical protein